MPFWCCHGSSLTVAVAGNLGCWYKARSRFGDSDEGLCTLRTCRYQAPFALSIVHVGLQETFMYGARRTCRLKHSRESQWPNQRSHEIPCNEFPRLLDCLSSTPFRTQHSNPPTRQSSLKLPHNASQRNPKLRVAPSWTLHPGTELQTTNPA